MRGGAKLSWASGLMLQARAAWCRGQSVCMLPAGGLRCTLLSVGRLPCMYCTFLCPHFYKAIPFHISQRMCSKRHVGSSHTAEPLGRLSAQGLPTSRMGSEACNAAQSEPFQKLLAMIRSNSREFQAEGRILRLKNYMRADAQPAEIDAVIEALEHNTRIEALYIQNFEMVGALVVAAGDSLPPASRPALALCCPWEPAALQGSWRGRVAHVNAYFR